MMKSQLSLFLLFLTACGSPKENATVEYTTMPFPVAVATGAPPKVSKKLTLAQALALTGYHNRALKSYSKEIRLAETARLGAILRPRPEVSFEVEDIMGTGQRKLLTGATATLGISYAFELGGKRALRGRVVDAQVDLAKVSYTIKRRNLFLEMSLAYVDVLALEHQVALQKKMEALDKDIRKVFQAKVSGGILSPLVLKKFDVEAGLRKTDRIQSRNELALARLRLASFWGSTTPRFKKVDSCFYMYKKLKPITQLEKRLKTHPELVYFKAIKALRARELDLAKSDGQPDITVSAGIRYYQDLKDVGGVIGVSVPLFSGRVGAATAARVRARIERDFAQRANKAFALKIALREAHQKMRQYEGLAQAYWKKHLPAARATHEKFKEGYRIGKFSYLELLDAKAMALNINQKFLKVMLKYTRAYVVLSYLTGVPPASRQKGALAYCL